MISKQEYSKYVRQLKAKYEAEYKKVSSPKERVEVIQKMVDYKLIDGKDARINVLPKTANRKRDLRKQFMKAFIARCPYFEYPDTIIYDAEIQPHDGVRSYKETTWQVKYPSSKGEIRLTEMAQVDSISKTLEHIKSIANKYGCEWEDINNSDFGIMFACGYWAVYQMKMRRVAGCAYDVCGYAFVEKGDSDKVEDYIIHIITDNDVLERGFLIPQYVINDADKAIRDGILNEHRRIKMALEEKEMILKERAEAKQRAKEKAEAKERAEAKKNSKKSTEKNNKSSISDKELERVEEARALRVALGME